MESIEAINKRKNHPKKVTFQEKDEVSGKKENYRLSKIFYSFDGMMTRLVCSVSVKELSSWLKNIPEDIEI